MTRLAHYSIGTVGTTIALTLMPLTSSGANILLTNDDGMNTKNLVAAYESLKGGGHDVVVVSPFGQQSGKGPTFDLAKAIPAIAKEAHGIPAGAPGIGQHPKDENIYYVNSTPATAIMYGLDIVARERWSAAPDLVVSGVNRANNVGRFVTISGTVGAARVAAERGTSAVAFSAPYIPVKGTHKEVGAIVLRVVNMLVSNAKDGTLLPKDVFLNVNIPAFNPGQGDSLNFKWTETGRYVSFINGALQPSVGVAFTPDLRQDKLLASRFKDAKTAQPGIGLPLGELDPALETNRNSEALHLASEIDKETKMVIKPGYVTITPLAVDPTLRGPIADEARARLDGLLQ